MRLRSLLAFAAMLILPATASAQDVVPLTGTGENVAPVARIKVPGANEIAVAGNWAFVSTDSNDNGCGCLYIVNTKDPAHPFIEGVWDSTKEATDVEISTPQSYGDVDISPDGNLAVLTNAHGSGPTWAVLIDTTDKAHPKFLSKIDSDGTMDYVHTSTLDNNTLYMNPQVFLGYPQPGDAHITVVDIKDRLHPKILGKIETPASDVGLAHDSYVDHRPDGKTLLYAASIHRSDVLDITDPPATWMQTTTSYDYTISHDVQPNWDRSLIVVDDEGGAGGQLADQVSVCGKAGTGPATVDSGSVHFYAAAPDGTFANQGLVQLGTFNAPVNANDGACVAHVFWQAPNENRLTQAYYNEGAWIVDYSDPANATALGHFDGDDATYWSAKPNNGYIYASNMRGSVDIMKYTGEGGTRWPATAGPAEIQLAARQGVAYKPIAGTNSQPSVAPSQTPADTRTFGRFSFKAKLKKVPGKRGKKAKLAITFKDAAGKTVGTFRFKKKAGRKITLKVSGVAASGKYSWAVKAGKRKLKAGKLTVAAVKDLKASQTLVAKVR